MSLFVEKEKRVLIPRCGIVLSIFTVFVKLCTLIVMTEYSVYVIIVVDWMTL